MRDWIGRWLMGVAFLHTVLAVLVFRNVFGAFARQGVVGAVGADAKANLGVWFLSFGIVLWLCALALSALERAAVPVPKAIGWGLLVLGVAGAALVPVSGFWLLLPPALALVTRKTARRGFLADIR